MRNECYISSIALQRTVLDQIPPLFGFQTFEQVVANYKCGRSMKTVFKQLDESLREIANHQLHEMIRRKEILPTLSQVNFPQGFDLLLGEIVRRHKL